MRLSILTTFFMVLACVVADGERGAAERALIFATYVMEEINEVGTKQNPYKFIIASGCKGSRMGIRKQPGRCTLKELCEHLWMQSTWEEKAVDSEGKETVVTKHDTRPDKDKTVWTPNAYNGAAGLGNLDSAKIIQAIMGVQDETNINIPKKGYYGNLAVGNAIEGATDYYETMREFGRYTWKFHEQFLGVKEFLTAPVEIRLEKWYENAKTAANAVVDLRMKDKYMNEEDAIRNGLKKLFDPDTKEGKEKRNAVRLVKEKVPSLTEDRGLLGKKLIQKVNVEATAKKLAGPLGMSEEALKAKMEQILKAGAATEIGKNHQVAIDAAKRSASLVNSGTCA